MRQHQEVTRLYRSQEQSRDFTPALHRKSQLCDPCHFATILAEVTVVLLSLRNGFSERVLKNNYLRHPKQSTRLDSSAAEPSWSTGRSNLQLLSSNDRLPLVIQAVWRVVCELERPSLPRVGSPENLQPGLRMLQCPPNVRERIAKRLEELNWRTVETDESLRVQGASGNEAFRGTICT
jgi:hypothetical protein